MKNCSFVIVVGFLLSLGLLSSLSVSHSMGEETVRLNGHEFTLAEGMTIELAVDSQLCPRPITASFDDQGVLYVADSSGSNDPVKQQLENPTHRILRLRDMDGDGSFDSSTVFADRMMFPEGTLWYQGSLYVAAPPHIWKLTDEDGDGVAEQREIWFDGKTLTGCANDLHGPYLGRDGWIYWCKGAFAEQTYQRRNGTEWSTRAAHVFRRHPQGGEVQPLMAGGMDNPVDVVMTPGGEKIFTTTFLTHPGQGQRDGLIHAVYGGVYGKDHGVIQGHPRTGGLLPPLTHLGAAAPCGLELVEGRDVTSIAGHRLLTCSFNLHKVFWHSLSYDGSQLQAPAEDLLVSNQLDFHPTDIVQAPDGSWLVLDTGGWYKLCCPTSQLVKPDVLGGIYRIYPKDAERMSDPLGQQLEWENASQRELIERFDDPRLFVRRHAIEQVGLQGEAAVGSLRRALVDSNRPRVRLNAVWCLSQIAGESARAAARVGLQDEFSVVRQATLHTIALHQDANAADAILDQMNAWQPATQRVACEALGRIGQSKVVSALLSLAAADLDRMLEHSVIYALIEIGNRELLVDALSHESLRSQKAAAIALDQLGDNDSVQSWVFDQLTAKDDSVATAAKWILTHHPEWGAQLAQRIPEWLDEMADDPSLVARFKPWLETQLKDQTATQSVVAWIQNQIQQQGWTSFQTWVPLRLASPDGFEASLTQAILPGLSNTPVEVQKVILEWLATSTQGVSADAELRQALDQIVLNSEKPIAIRWAAALCRSGPSHLLPEDLFDLTLQRLNVEKSPTLRQQALRLLQQWPVDDSRRRRIVPWLKKVPATEVTGLLTVMKGGESNQVGLDLVRSLMDREVYRWVPELVLRESLESYDLKVEAAAEVIWQACQGLRAEQTSRLEALIAELPPGDIRRGQQLFHEQKTQCIQCHQMGYLGGKLGPDLTRIGGIRQQKDLLEAIVFPSISFVRSYEPVVVTTLDGRQIQGLIVEQDDASVTLAIGGQRTERVARDDVDEMAPGSVSLMPSGFDQQLNPQELADLVEFLKASR